MTKKELIESMAGYEIPSLQYEGVVLMRKDGSIIRAFDQKVFHPTIKQLNTLFDEMIYDEFGTNDTEQILRQEGFGFLLDK